MVKETALGVSVAIPQHNAESLWSGLFLPCHSNLLANSLVLSFCYILIPLGHKGTLRLPVTTEELQVL